MKFFLDQGTVTTLILKKIIQIGTEAFNTSKNDLLWPKKYGGLPKWNEIQL